MSFKGKVCLGLVGIVLGVGAVKGVHSAVAGDIDDIRTFRLGIGKPRLMRIYKEFGFDEILVENPAKRGDYIPLRQYLDTIRDRGKREVAEARIKDAVGWYD